MKSIQDFFTTRHDQELRIGFFGVGYDVYWNQFPGLLDELMIKHQIIMAKVPKENRIIVDFGMIDNPETAYQKVNEIKSANIDILFCNMLNYATSAAGSVRVEIQDAEGHPLPGYTLAESPERYGDEIEGIMSWQGGASVAALAGRSVRLRLVLRDADVYALRFRE